AGYVVTKGTGIFQTVNGYPQTLRSADTIPIANRSTQAFISLCGCLLPPDASGVRLKATSDMSIGLSMAKYVNQRLKNELSASGHCTWSSFIDKASDPFNPSVRGEVAIAQNSFDRHADRARSTYDRPHRFTVNAVYELPSYRSQTGALGHFLGGWQVG